MQSCGKLVFKYLKRNGKKNYRICNSVFSKEKVSDFTPNKLVSQFINERNNFKNINDLVKHIKENPYNLKHLTSVLFNSDLGSLSSNEAISLIENCGKTTPNLSRKNRHTICQQIYQKLLTLNKVDSKIFHIYLNVCNENFTLVDYKHVLETFQFKPSRETYKLLLKNVCQQGNVDDALGLLETMKTLHFSIDEEMFSDILYASALQGGMKATDDVLQIMKLAHMPEGNNVKLAILKGLMSKRHLDELKIAILKDPFQLNHEETLSFIEHVGITENYALLPQLEPIYRNIDFTPDMLKNIEDICIHLIYMGKTASAIAIFKHFYNRGVVPLSGDALLQEMLQADTDIEAVISLAKYLYDNEANDFALENLTEFALKYHYTKRIWALFENINVRCHFFWPLLIAAGKTSAENGILQILQKMKQFGIKPNAETFEDYILPYCDLSDKKLFIAKLQQADITVKDILNPMIIFLLGKSRIKEASGLCNSYNVQISGEKLLKLLSSSWKATGDSESLVILFQRYYESNTHQTNTIGIFLIKLLKMCSREADFQNFLKLIQIFRLKRWNINLSSADELRLLLKKCNNENVKSNIESAINDLQDITLKFNHESATIVHPRYMGLDDLESHLIELEGKELETRGVIRKLIQLHARHGNINRVKELRDKFLTLGHEESPGMKSSIMYNYVQGRHLEEALNVYNDISTSHPKFSLDHFKCIDLAQLLVENSRFEEAMELLRKEVKKFEKVGSKEIQRNCRLLLNSCSNDQEQKVMFYFLIENNLCKPVNVILGPLVRIQLKENKLDGAVEKYMELSKKYKCTPLQREILCSVLKTENSELLQKVVKATESVHGAKVAEVGLISALAENQQLKPLRKALIQSKVHFKPLMEKQCQRWVQEKKVKPLIALAKVADRISNDVLDLNFVYKCIFDYYGFINDCNAALSFYETIPEDFAGRPEIEKYVVRTLKKCNYEIPKQFNIING